MKKPVLENERVKLTVLNLDNYKVLEPIAQEKDLIFYSPSDISTPIKLKDYVKTALEGYKDNSVLPFLIYDKLKQNYAGSSRFGHIDHNHKTLHIGWTWIGHDFQGTGLNVNIKFLMLQYTFETLKFEKVEFRIDERNLKSRKAVEKLGVKLEGVLRANVLMTNGFRRNTCCYGVVKSEWPQLKAKLIKKL